MQLEQVKPNKPSFGLVVMLACATLLAAFIAAAIIVGWRAHKKNVTPYNKHPESQLRLTLPPGSQVA